MSEERSLNFIEEIIEQDLKDGKHSSIVTRFPPEPNGYLHIGHAKSICLNFGLIERYGGYTNLRFDDTNPVTEETEYVESIKEDVQWLGFKWKNELYASDYFDELYEFAVKLIKKGLAYIDDSSPEEIAGMKELLLSLETTVLTGIELLKKTFAYLKKCVMVNMRMVQKCFVQRLIWRTSTCICVTPLCIVLSTQSITVQAINGAFIQCTILLMAKVTLLKR
jgi:hypothetical protein